MSPQPGLPSGTVTFLFTDIEGSTRLLEQLGRDRYESVLAEQAGIVRAAVAAHDGWLVDTQGDSLFCAFRAARDGVLAAVAAQRELEARGWPEHVRVRLRMGLHSGEPKASEERYIGIGVHRAARIGAAAHGGQVLASATTQALVEDDLPAGVSMRDLGVHRLKDIAQPVRLYQVVAAGLQQQFPPPRTPRAGRSRRARLALAAVALAIAGGAAAGVVLATESASAKPVRLVANSIAVIDPKTGRPVGDVPLGFSPTDVVAGGDKVWVLNSGARTVAAIDPKTLRVSQPVGLDGDPVSEYASGNTDFVAVTGAVDEIDPSGLVRVALWRPPGRTSAQARFGTDSDCGAFVSGNGRRVWVSEVRHFAELDAPSGGVLRRLTLPDVQGAPAGTDCYGIHYGDGHLLAIRTLDHSLGTLDPRSGAYLPIQVVSGLSGTYGGSSGWEVGFGRLWVSGNEIVVKTLNPQGFLTSYDLTSGQVTTRTTIGRSAGAVAVDPASGVWVLDPVAKVLVRVDPGTGLITRATPLHHFTCCAENTLGSGVAAGHGRIWVALQSP